MVQILKYHEAKCLIYKGLLSPGDWDGSLSEAQGGSYRVRPGMILFSTLSILVST